MNDQSPDIKKTPSQVLREWADKIEKNDPEDFSGAFVILPPKSEPITGLIINQDADLGTFFSVVKSKVEMAVDAINDSQQVHKTRW